MMALPKTGYDLSQPNGNSHFNQGGFNALAYGALAPRRGARAKGAHHRFSGAHADML